MSVEPFDEDNLVLREISVPKEYAEAIGLVAVHWSALEASVESGIWYLMGMEPGDQRANVLTAEMGMIMRLYAVSSLLALDGEPYAIAAWKTLVARIDNLRNRRNRVIHAEWRRMRDGTVRAKKTSAKGMLRPVIEEKTVAEIHALAAEIANCYAASEGFFLQHWLTKDEKSASSS